MLTGLIQTKWRYKSFNDVSITGVRTKSLKKIIDETFFSSDFRFWKLKFWYWTENFKKAQKFKENTEIQISEKTGYQN